MEGLPFWERNRGGRDRRSGWERGWRERMVGENKTVIRLEKLINELTNQLRRKSIP